MKVPEVCNIEQWHSELFIRAQWNDTSWDKQMALHASMSGWVFWCTQLFESGLAQPCNELL